MTTKANSHFVDSDVTGTSGLDSWTSDNFNPDADSTFDYPQLQDILESYVSNRIDNIFDDIEVVDPQGTTAIDNEAELLDIGVGQPLNGSYYLTTNIVVTGTKTVALIGSSGNPFIGTFDGRGFKITYVLDDGGRGSQNGLFHGIEDGALVQNLLIDATMTVANDTGILAGFVSVGASPAINIKNTHVRGTISIVNTWPSGDPSSREDVDDVCGFIGSYDASSGGAGNEIIVTDCTANVAITLISNDGTTNRIAGFTGGFVARKGIFTNCHTGGSITTTDSSEQGDDFGGFVCRTADSIFSKCSANVTLTIGGEDAGGFCGDDNGDNVFSECFSLSNVTVDDNGSTGGFSRGGLSSGSTCTNCYAKGDVESTGAGLAWTGGFIGSAAGTITNCYSIGAVTGLFAEGGFSGESFGTETSSYWDTETSGQATSDGDEVGKTTTLMKTQSTYLNWDFDDIWVMPIDSLGGKTKTGEQNRTTAMPEDHAHLNGQTVQGLGDGSYLGTDVVADGEVTMDDQTIINHVGLQYTSTILPMKIDGEVRIKRISKIIPNVNETVGGTYGRSIAKLGSMVLRDANDPLDTDSALFTGTVDLPFDGEYARNADIYIRQTFPLPMKLLGIGVDLSVEAI